MASHPRSFLAAKHSTLTEQIPKAHREYAKWTPQRIVAWVGQTKAATAAVVEQILSRKTYSGGGRS